MGATPSRASWDVVTFASSARPVSITMTYNITHARARNVALVAKPNASIITRVVDKRPVTLVLDAITNSLVSSAWVTITCIPPPTGKELTLPKRSNLCVPPYASAPYVTDSFDPTKLRDQRMPLLQTISWSHQTSMLHPESHQTRIKEKIIEIPKTEGRRVTESGRKRQSLCLLGQRNHARHGGSRAQSGVCCYFQQRRTVSFWRPYLHRSLSRLVEGIGPGFQTHHQFIIPKGSILTSS